MKRRPERLMWFRLAAKLGRTVAEAQATVDAREFAEWMAYYSLEPWGHESDWLRTGQVAATVYNCAMGRRGPALTPLDFMPRAGGAEAQSAEEMQSRLRWLLTAKRKKAGNGKRR